MANDPRNIAREGVEVKNSYERLLPVFQQIETELLGQIVKSDIEDVDTRENCFMQINAIKLLQDKVKKIVGKGIFASAEIEQAANKDRSAYTNGHR